MINICKTLLNNIGGGIGILGQDLIVNAEPVGQTLLNQPHPNLLTVKADIPITDNFFFSPSVGWSPTTNYKQSMLGFNWKW